MATISVDKEIVQTVARQLLALAADVNSVNFTHGPRGSMFVVPDELAEAWALSHAEDGTPDGAPKKKGK